MARRRRADEQHIIRGVRTSTANNAPAYGFSLAATGSYAALIKVRGDPTWLELFLFLIAACAAFAIVNGLATWFFRKESPDEPEVVISLATSLSVFSVCGSVGAASGIAFALPDGAAWPVAALVFPLVYIVGVGAEIGFAARQHPHGGVEAERRRRATS
jgi:succinate dehydrogenase/fumarate reductase cytochrome b subunit